MNRPGEMTRPSHDASARRAPSGRIGLFQIVLGLLVVAMAVELVLLIRQNRRLKDSIGRLETTITEMQAAPGRQPLASGLQAGDLAPTVLLPAIDGSRVAVAYDEPERETWLLVFSPDCPACVANIENWKRLEQGSDPAGRRLVYVSTASADRTSTFITERQLGGTVLLGDPRSLAGFRLTFIPTTIRIAPGGEVRDVWIGRLPDGAIDGS